MDLMTLPAVAEETHQPEDQLRRWCATGKLRCERDGRSWLIPTAELPQVERLGRRRGKASAPRPLLGVAFPGSSGQAGVADEIAALLGVDSERVDVRYLAIDGQPFVVAAWTDQPGREATTRLEELASERGGELLEGVPGGASIPVIPRVAGPAGPPDGAAGFGQRAAASTPASLGRSVARPG